MSARCVWLVMRLVIEAVTLGTAVDLALYHESFYDGASHAPPRHPVLCPWHRQWPDLRSWWEIKLRTAQHSQPAQAGHPGRAPGPGDGWNGSSPVAPGYGRHGGNGRTRFQPQYHGSHGRSGLLVHGRLGGAPLQGRQPRESAGSHNLIYLIICTCTIPRKIYHTSWMALGRQYSYKRKLPVGSQRAALTTGQCFFKQRLRFHLTVAVTSDDVVRKCPGFTHG